MTLGEARLALCRKLEINYTDVSAGLNDLFSSTDIDEFILTGVGKAWDFHKWPFTEGSKTYTPVTKAEYYPVPNNIVDHSIDFLMVNGEEYTKRSWQSYRKALALNSSTTEKIYTIRNGNLFINKNCYSAGDTIDVFGKLKMPAIDTTSSSSLLPFSPTEDNQQYSGNDAVIQLAYAEALASEKMKNPAQANSERQLAYQTLEILWKPFAAFLAQEQQNGRPLMEVPDLFPGRSRRTQRATFEGVVS